MRGWRWALVVALAVAVAGCRDRPAEKQSAAHPTAKRRAVPPASSPRVDPTLRSPLDPAPAPAPSFSVAPGSATPSAAAAPSSAANASARLESYPPRDECARLPGFPAFRAKLFAAVQARDSAALVALADPVIHLDFGGGAGADEFRRRLDTADTPLWDELAALGTLGCAADKGVATLPWIFARVPAAVDPYRTMLVTGAGVPLRAKSGAAAAVVRRLDWSLVEVSGQGFDAKAPFTAVLAGGTPGFVATARLRSIVGYRLIADRSGGEWRISAFVAGD